MCYPILYTYMVLCKIRWHHLCLCVPYPFLPTSSLLPSLPLSLLSLPPLSVPFSVSPLLSSLSPSPFFLSFSLCRKANATLTLEITASRAPSQGRKKLLLDPTYPSCTSRKQRDPQSQANWWTEECASLEDLCYTVLYMRHVFGCAKTCNKSMYWSRNIVVTCDARD